ncbi:hypothetical protein BJF78_16845 [Pseudonocardia sp. CNS-139]|nr:hypothetical protein BJF78_16845 [Pseudonocardia sp. CNS-139]
MRRPDLIGAPAPTGATLAAEIAAVVPGTCPATVVELGPGTGAISPSVRARLAPGSRYVAVELDGELVTHLRGTLPWLEVLAGDAADLGTLLAGAGVGPVDAVVSSLPWTLLPPERRRATLAAIAATLAPGGVFATISTLTALPALRRDVLRDLGDTYDEVLATRPIWRNVPPSRLLVCRRPHRW